MPSTRENEEFHNVGSVEYVEELVPDLGSVVMDGDNVVLVAWALFLLLDGEDAPGGADHGELLIGVDDSEKERNGREKKERKHIVDRGRVKEKEREAENGGDDDARIVILVKWNG
ncbi:hypothetical protein RIF29_28467 [Crotalaria pallida]|uniref:Uncharacterized protein n=1 Tax=Crotalaria pallida TaxID=3830 RepID=A0AAN9EEU7_CROPI